MYGSIQDWAFYSEDPGKDNFWTAQAEFRSHGCDLHEVHGYSPQLGPTVIVTSATIEGIIAQYRHIMGEVGQAWVSCEDPGELGELLGEFPHAGDQPITDEIWSKTSVGWVKIATVHP